MPRNILDVAENKDEILSNMLSISCPNCNERFHSIFDRLYILVYDTCYTCDDSTEERLERRSSNIFNIS